MATKDRAGTEKGKFKLTKRTLDARVKAYRKGNPGPKGLVWVGDTEVPGFGARIYAKGSPVFCLRYRTKSGRHRMFRLGTLGELTVETARARARAEKERVLRGEDPQGERQKGRAAVGLQTVKDLLTRWLEDYAKDERRSWREDERRVNGTLVPKLGALALEDLTPPRLKALHKDLGKRAPVEANRTVEALRAAWKWAEQEKLLPEGLQDPTQGFGGRRGFRNKEHSRDRWLREEETERLLEAVRAEEDPYVRAAVPLLLLSGLRKRELLSARWANVDLTRGEVRLEETKAGEPQTRTLTADAVRILKELPRMVESPFVFPSPKDPSKPRGDLKKAWERIREAAGLGDVTLHDLRRTCGSYLAQAGVPLYTIRDILGQKHEKVTRVYARLSQDDERRALEALSLKLRPLLGGAKAPEEGGPLPERLRALLAAAGDDPEALENGLRGLVRWEKAAKA